MDFIRNQPEDVSNFLKVREEVLEEIVSVLKEWHTQGDAGMQFAFYKEGMLALEVAIGRDPFTGRKIDTRTLFCLLSTTKALASMVMLLLHDRGFFEWTDKIVKYWPEFGEGGKEEATIEHLMSHRVGIPSLTADWHLWNDHNYMVNLVEGAQAMWEPGTRYGYHGGIFGTMIKELVRRWTGQTVGNILHEEICVPLGHSDCYIGLPSSALSRVAKLQFLEEDLARSEAGKGLEEHPPWGEDQEYNSPIILSGCHPSGGGVATARDLAGVFNVLAFEGTYGGRTYWSKRTQREATRARNLASQEAPASGSLAGGCWGLGFIVHPTPRLYGTRPPSTFTVGHAGASGSIAYADPELRIAVGFTINGILGSRHFMRYEILGNLVQQACDIER